MRIAILSIVFTLGLATGCLPIDQRNEARTQQTSRANGRSSGQPKPLEKENLASFAIQLYGGVQTKRHCNPSANNDQTAIVTSQKVLISLVEKSGGVPRSQITKVLEDLLIKNPLSCDQKFCEDLFGIKGGGIPAYLDSIFEQLSHRDGTSSLLLDSFRPVQDKAAKPKTPLSGRVIFKLAEGIKGFVKHSGITIMDPNYYASVDIYPRDLLRAKRLVCNETECQAEIVQPIAFGANLPILNSLLIIRYQRSTNLASGQNHHEAYIGGRYSPVSIGKILKVSFDFGWDINNAPKTAESGANGHPWITKFDCGVSAYCHTPLLSFGVIIGRKGLHFDSYANGGLSRSIGPYVNVTPALPPDLLSVEYKDLKLPPWLRRVIDQVKDGPSVDPDIAWSAWAERI